MAIFIILWSSLFTAKLRCLQKNKSGHTNDISPYQTTLPIRFTNQYFLWLENLPIRSVKLIVKVVWIECTFKLETTPLYRRMKQYIFFPMWNMRYRIFSGSVCLKCQVLANSCLFESQVSTVLSEYKWISNLCANWW